MGGGGNSASKEAQQQADEQKAQIAQSQAAINALFNDPKRTAQYDKLGADTTSYYTGEVNRQNQQAQRNLKFALARSGLSGGSQQAFDGQELGKDYQKGLLQASQQGQTAANNLRAADEQSRTQLIGLAQSGLDATQASSQGALSLQNNLLAGQGQANVNQLGDLFGNLGQVYSNSQQQDLAKKGFLFGYGQGYQPLFGAGAQPNYNGY